MHTQQLRDRFIELRIEGKTLRAIADELKISKSTVCDWNIEYGARIVEGQRIAMEAAMEELLAGPVARVQNLAEIYAKVHKRIIDDHRLRPEYRIDFEPLMKIDAHLRKIMPPMPRQSKTRIPKSPDLKSAIPIEIPGTKPVQDLDD